MALSKDLDTRPKKSVLRIGLVTCCMVGLEFTWVVQFAYGTPYLLSLGLTKEITALVWLSAPISGLIVQPIIGAWSDKCMSKLGRRRPFIITGGILVCVSLLSLGYVEPIAQSLESNHDETMMKDLKIAIAVLSVYILDFAANTLEAGARSLFLDMFPTSQQNTVSVFSSIFYNVADVAGYLLGYLSLAEHLHMSENSQMGALCSISAVIAASTIVIGCLSAQELPISSGIVSTMNNPWYQTFVDIWYSIRRLPYSIQMLCNAQFFGWMYWFQFATYITTWIAEIYSKTHHSEQWDEGVRVGSLAMGLSAVVSIVAGTILPSAIKHGILSRKSMYTLSHILSAATMFLVPFIHTVSGGIVLCSIMGVSWIITMWIPYSLISEYLVLEQHKQKQHPYYDYHRTSSPSSSQFEEESTPLLLTEKKDMDAGIVLGIHKVYTMLPQFIGIAAASIIFSIAHSLEQQASRSSDNQGVSWVLEFCGATAIIAAIVSRRIVDVD